RTLLQVPLELKGNVAHDILDELRILVGALRHVLFVLTLQDRIKLAARAALRNFDEVFEPDDLFVLADLDRNQRTLIVSAEGADLLAARAEARRVHADFDLPLV